MGGWSWRWRRTGDRADSIDDPGGLGGGSYDKFECYIGSMRRMQIGRTADSSIEVCSLSWSSGTRYVICKMQDAICSRKDISRSCKRSGSDPASAEQSPNRLHRVRLERSIRVSSHRVALASQHACRTHFRFRTITACLVYPGPQSAEPTIQRKQ